MGNNKKVSILDEIVDYLIYSKYLKPVSKEDVEELRNDILQILESKQKITEIKIYSKSGNIPQYQTVGSAAMDIHANIENNCEIDNMVNCRLFTDIKGAENFIDIEPGGRCVIPTGLYCELPDDYKFSVKGRSGLAAKEGLQVHLGTIDSDYRGEIGVICTNLGNKHITIKNGDRVAQLELERIHKAKLVPVSSLSLLSETERGKGGYGHTGK